jgi:hypothetical protein
LKSILMWCSWSSWLSHEAAASDCQNKLKWFKPPVGPKYKLHSLWRKEKA